VHQGPSGFSPVGVYPALLFQGSVWLFKVKFIFYHGNLLLNLVVVGLNFIHSRPNFSVHRLVSLLLVLMNLLPNPQFPLVVARLKLLHFFDFAADADSLLFICAAELTQQFLFLHLEKGFFLAMSSVNHSKELLKLVIGLS
jgi:hypothetical protein